MTLEDAMDLAEMLERTGRAVPRNRWVEAAIEAARAAETEDSLDSLGI